MRGHTLLELLCTLVLASICVSALVPGMRQLRDRAIAGSVREQLVAGFSEARASAVRAGGANLTIRRVPPAYRVDHRDRTGRWTLVDLPAGTLHLDGSRDSIVVEFDRMGIGRVASRSIDVVVGDVRRGLVVSSYGRIRRR